jgi:hypothetical protein
MSNPSDVVKQRRGGGRVYDTLSAPLAAQQNEHLVTRQEESKERGGRRLNTTDHESAYMWAGPSKTPSSTKRAKHCVSRINYAANKYVRCSVRGEGNVANANIENVLRKWTRW